MAGDADAAVRRAVRIAAMTANVAGSYVGYMMQRWFLDERGRERRLKSAHLKAGARVREELQQLRGPVMKIGQALSLRAEMLPEEVVAELSKLQMEAPAMHPSLMRAQVRASLGADPDEIFRSFDAEPFAAASLGQVHRAVTRDGDRVVVKIQYPGIRRAIENDFKVLRSLTRPAQASGHLTRAFLEELETQIAAETDYRREAANIALFANGLAPLSFATVPRVYDGYSTDRVLTMSAVPGHHLDRFLAQRPAQRTRDQVGSRLFELLYFQLLKMGVVHADPHPGNYLFAADAAIGMVDFGCVKRMRPAAVSSMKALFLYSGARGSRDFQRRLDETYAAHGRPLSAPTRRVLTAFSEDFYRKVYPPDPPDRGRAIDFSDARILRHYLEHSARIMRTKGVLPELLFFARAELGLYSTLHRLKARVRTSEILSRYL